MMVIIHVPITYNEITVLSQLLSVNQIQSVNLLYGEHLQVFIKAVTLEGWSSQRGCL